MKTLRENELLSDILKKDLDDFWNDCLNITNSPTCKIVFKNIKFNFSWWK